MELYRAIWLRAAGFVMMAGLCVALAVFPLPGLSIAFGLSALIGCTAVWTWADCRDGRRLAKVGLVTGCGVLGIGACTVLFGPAGLALVTLLALSSPPLLTWLTWRLSHPEGPGRGDRQVTAAAWGTGTGARFDAVATWSAERTLAREEWMARSPTTMDASQLCTAWRRSFVTLGQPLSLTSRMLVVKRRQELLDELERRNPSGFSAWLGSGARAAGDPRRYIVSQRGEEPRL